MVSVFGRLIQTLGMLVVISQLFSTRQHSACSGQAIILLILSGEEEGLRKRLDNESDKKTNIK